MKVLVIVATLLAAGYAAAVAWPGLAMDVPAAAGAAVQSAMRMNDATNSSCQVTPMDQATSPMKAMGDCMSSTMDSSMAAPPADGM